MRSVSPVGLKFGSVCIDLQDEGSQVHLNLDNGGDIFTSQGNGTVSQIKPVLGQRTRIRQNIAAWSKPIYRTFSNLEDKTTKALVLSFQQGFPAILHQCQSNLPFDNNKCQDLADRMTAYQGFPLISGKSYQYPFQSTLTFVLQEPKQKQEQLKPARKQAEPEEIPLTPRMKPPRRRWWQKLRFWK